MFSGGFGGGCRRSLGMCLVVSMLSSVVFMHVDSRCRHVSVSSSGKRLQRGEGH